MTDETPARKQTGSRRGLALGAAALVVALVVVAAVLAVALGSRNTGAVAEACIPAEETLARVAPTATGEDLRLTYYLYRGDAPSDPSEGSAYRTLSLWVDVSGDGQAALAAR